MVVFYQSKQANKDRVSKKSPTKQLAMDARIANNNNKKGGNDKGKGKKGGRGKKDNYNEYKALKRNKNKNGKKEAAKKMVQSPHPIKLLFSHFVLVSHRRKSRPNSTLTFPGLGENQPRCISLKNDTSRNTRT